MPDQFTNARPYFDVTFPSSGDGFSISGTRNALGGLGFLDVIPLQPRAHNPANTSIMIRGRDASSFYNPVYYGDADQRVPFSSGDTGTFSAPSSNPRIDIVYLTPSGDLKIQQGTEAASPSLPSLAPSGDSRFPICAVYNKVGQAKIVNFEDKDSNTGDGYIYQDLRPWMRTAGAGSVQASSLTPLSTTGDNAAGIGSTASRYDHTHQGVHSARVIGTGDGLGNAQPTAMFGDVEFAGGVSQNNRRISIANIPMGAFRNLKVTRPSATTVKVEFDELVLHDQNMRAGWDAKKSVTIDITVAGAGGLDGGSEQANKIYFIWIIRNSNTGVVNGILSASAVNPTMPSGFNQKALVSSVGNDNSSNFIAFRQTGRRYTFNVWATMISDAQTAWQAVNMTPTNMSTNAGFVPSELSNFCFGSLVSVNSVCQVTNDNSITTTVSAAAPNKITAASLAQNVMTYWQFDILTANTLYVGLAGVNDALYLHGFEINKLT